MPSDMMIISEAAIKSRKAGEPISKLYSYDSFNLKGVPPGIVAFFEEHHDVEEILITKKESKLFAKAKDAKFVETILKSNKCHTIKISEGSKLF